MRAQEPVPDIIDTIGMGEGAMEVVSRHIDEIQSEEELVKVLEGALEGLHVLTAKLAAAATCNIEERDVRHEREASEQLREYMHDMYAEFCELCPLMVRMAKGLDTHGHELAEQQSPLLREVVEAYCNRLKNVLTMVRQRNKYYWNSTELAELRTWVRFWGEIRDRLEGARQEKDLRLEMARDDEQVARVVRLRRVRRRCMLNTRQLFEDFNTRENTVKTIYDSIYVNLIKEVFQFIMSREEAENSLYTKSGMFDCPRLGICDADNEAWTTNHTATKGTCNGTCFGTWGTYLFRMTQYFFLLTIGDEEDQIIALVYRWSLHRMLLWYQQWMGGKTWLCSLVPHHIVETGCKIEAEKDTTSAITVKQWDFYEQMFWEGLPEDSISMKICIEYQVLRKRPFVIVSESRMGARRYWDKPKPILCDSNNRQGMAGCLHTMSGYEDVIGIAPVPFTASRIKEQLEELHLPLPKATTVHIFWSMRELGGRVVTPSDTIIEEWKALIDWCAENKIFPYITINSAAARLLDEQEKQEALYQMSESIGQNAKGKAIVDFGLVFWRAFYNAEETCCTANFVGLYDKTILRQRVILDLMPTKVNWDELQRMTTWVMLKSYVENNRGDVNPVTSATTSNKRESEKHDEARAPEPGDQRETLQARSDPSEDHWIHPEKQDTQTWFEEAQAKGLIKNVRRIKTHIMSEDHRVKLGSKPNSGVGAHRHPQPEAFQNLFINHRLGLIGKSFVDYFGRVQWNGRIHYCDDDDPNGSILIPETAYDTYAFKWLNAPKYAKLPRFAYRGNLVLGTKWIRGWQGCQPETLFDTILEGRLRGDDEDPACGPTVRMRSDERRQQALLDVPWVPIFDDGTFLRFMWETRTDANATVRKKGVPTGVVLGREQSTHLWALHVEVSSSRTIENGALYQLEWDSRLEVVPRRLHELSMIWRSSEQYRREQLADPGCPWHLLPHHPLPSWWHA